MPQDVIEYSKPIGDQVADTTCYMRACRCGIKVHLRDGQLRYIEGNRNHAVNRGVLCGKGCAEIMNVFSPARLRKPLTRAGPRGSGQFTATRALGLIAACISLITVGCTAMIYASLKPIRQWRNPHTAPDYLIYAIFSGAVLLACLWALWFGTAQELAIAALPGAVFAAAAKVAYWRFIDRQKALATLASATGLSALGSVRPLDQPHFNILPEMGYRIARKHAVKLRHITAVLAFVVPALLMLLAALNVVPAITATAAALCALVGLFVERWMFFAEATHVSTIYYGR